MSDLPNPLNMRPVTDHDVAIWQQLFEHAGRFNTPEFRATAYTALVMACLRLRVSIGDLMNREV